MGVLNNHGEAIQELNRLLEENLRLRLALEGMLEDPELTLDEPDTDAEVIIKMRATIREALAC